MLRIVPLYAAVLALLFVVLSARVIQARRAERVILGTGGSPSLERRMRVQGNFAEYAPFALLLLAMAELRGAAPSALHLFALMLLAGRVLHAFGVSRSPEDTRLRIAGMIGTLTAVAGAAVLILSAWPA